MDGQITQEAKKRLDQLFESYSIIAEDTFVFLCDMQYDYSRWSKALVENFDLPSEYMYRAGEIWEEHIHPEDRKAYREGLDAIFSGRQAGHDMQYRARRPDSAYDMCTCRGIVIADDDGNPQYFGGAIRNHNKQSYIDSLTGLRNQYGFFSDLQSYIKNKIPIRIGMAGIGKLTEVNEVYGYHVGNKILQHFGRFLMDNVTLRAGGVRVALDDFGTGFSSVGLVKNLPFDTIKIDRSFVQQIEQDEREKKLLNNFTDIAGIFGADVCVEGIETTGMCDIIRDYGIHSFQGYYYSRPIPIDELLDKVKSGADCFAR